jgi:hypothetical protein
MAAFLLVTTLILLVAVGILSMLLWVVRFIGGGFIGMLQSIVWLHVGPYAWLVWGLYLIFLAYGLVRGF